jgi:hypothetical protein
VDATTGSRGPRGAAPQPRSQLDHAGARAAGEVAGRLPDSEGASEGHFHAPDADWTPNPSLIPWGARLSYPKHDRLAAASAAAARRLGGESRPFQLIQGVDPVQELESALTARLRDQRETVEGQPGRGDPPGIGALPVGDAARPSSAVKALRSMRLRD